VTATLRIAAWIALAGGVAVACAGLLAWWRERRVLQALLREIAPTGRFQSRDELVRLKHTLSSAIRWDPARMHDARSLLRASAARTLATGEGFCGENARVAVRILRLGGVPAHRLYLRGARWGHVVVEHRWDGGWRVFDAHDDPRTSLPDESVGRIDAEDLASFPNASAENPWRASHRIPLVGRWASRARPPAPLTVLAETPALMATTAGVAVALLALAALLGL
jgi:hypothetical protein